MHYKGNTETPTCECDPTQPTATIGKCKDVEARPPSIETTQSDNSTKSKKPENLRKK